MEDEEYFQLTEKGLEFVKEMARENPELVRAILEDFAAKDFPNDPAKAKECVDDMMKGLLGSKH